MEYHTRHPAPPLGLFVERLWYFSGGGLSHSRERVIPDGSAELVVHFEDVPRKRFHPDRPREFESVRRAWISGPQPGYTVIDVLPHATMMGAHFKPGGLAPFLSMPVGELEGAVLELDHIWGPCAGELRERLLASRTLQERFEVLENFLLRKAVTPLRSHGLVQSAIERLSETSDPPLVGSLAEDSGLSHKHFIEVFYRNVGLTPKRFRRIRRFQWALASLRRTPSRGWLDLAAECGYYDQAHFIHDFRAFSGFTPTQFSLQSGADTQFIPIDS